MTVRLADMSEKDAAYVRQGHTEVMLRPAGAHRGRFWPSAHCSCVHRHPPLSSGGALHAHSFMCNAPWVRAGHQAPRVASDCKALGLFMTTRSNSVTNDDRDRKLTSWTACTAPPISKDFQASLGLICSYDRPCADQRRRGTQLCQRLGLRQEDAPTTPDVVEGRHTARVVRALWSLSQACAGRGIQARQQSGVALCSCLVREAFSSCRL